MNEPNILIERNPKTRAQILKKNLKIKVNINKNYVIKKQARNKYITLTIGILAFIILCTIIIIKFKNKNNLKLKKITTRKTPTKTKSINTLEEIYKYMESSYENNYNKTECNELDPINIFKKRLTSESRTLCSNDDSNHICLIEDVLYYLKDFLILNAKVEKNIVIMDMILFIIIISMDGIMITKIMKMKKNN